MFWTVLWFLGSVLCLFIGGANKSGSLTKGGKVRSSKEFNLSSSCLAGSQAVTGSCSKADGLYEYFQASGQDAMRT